MKHIENKIQHAAFERIYIDCIEQLKRYQCFKYGWDGYSGEEFDQRLIDRVKRTVDYVYDAFRSRSEIPTKFETCPSVDGSIDFEIEYDNKLIVINFDQSIDRLEVYREENGSHVNTVFCYEIQLTQIINWLFEGKK